MKNAKIKVNCKLCKFLVVVLVLTFALPTIASCSISRDKTGKAGFITGAACSPSNYNVENSSIAGKSNLSPLKERDLRPVNPIKPKSTYDGCILGLCLYKDLLEGGRNFGQ